MLSRREISMTTTTVDAFALLVADIYEAAGLLRRFGERTADTEGQTQARWQILSVISTGDWTVPMAADRLGTSRQAVQRIANDLVTDGLAHFDDNPRHRRSPFLRLTPEGHDTLDAITKRSRERTAVLLKDLPAIDVEAVRVSLQQITIAVRSQLEIDQTVLA